MEVSRRGPKPLRLKYAIDRIAAAILLLLVTPLMAAIAVAIRIDDGGSVFFRQIRVGLNGRLFRIWKFRTMVPDAWEIGQGYMPANTELVTKVGAFLRRSSLDELPQIFNILKGEMSFVGPRPTLLSQVERYTPRQRERLLVKPGILGWAQLHGRHALPWSKRIDYDLEYIARASLAFDLAIVLRSIPLVIRGSGIKLYQAPDEVDDLGAETASNSSGSTGVGGSQESSSTASNTSKSMGEHEMHAEFLAPDAPAWKALLPTIRHDFYHLPEYARFASRRQETGVPSVFVAGERGRRLLVPIIVRPIPLELGDGLYDAISPRGFPGPLLAVDPDCDPDFPSRAVEAFVDGLRSRGIVTAYIRLHPLLLPPLEALRRVGLVVEHGDSVSIDLTLSPDELWRQTRENHRRDINKATRLGYVARIDEKWERLDAFVDVYHQSMERLGADVFWRLPSDYFTDLRESLGRNVRLCVVEVGGELAAGAILTEEDGIVEYHLAGTADAHIAASPSKMVVDFARRWAQDRGNRSLHLAGTPGRGDSLTQFKVGFSPLLHPVYSWRLVPDPNAYDRLVDQWQAGARAAAASPDAFFPAYRGPRSI